MLITFKGVILRETSVGDRDKMMTVLTDKFGKISLFGKGVKSLKSRLMTSTQLFTYSEFSVTRQKDYFYLSDATKLESFYNLRTSIERISLANYIAETALDVSSENEPDEELLRLVLNTLFAISRSLAPLDRIKGAYEMRCACIIGFKPNFLGCASCSDFEAEKYFFSISDGSATCDRCYHESVTDLSQIEADTAAAYEYENRIIVQIPKSAFQAIRYVVYCDMKKLFSFSLNDDAVLDFYTACEKYFLFHLGRGFISLEFLNDVGLK